jgi:ABC-type dipeptide/oligopeptide/nickel transport system ATPase component
MHAFAYDMSVSMMEANKFVFQHPTRCVISGPSGCGKSEFMQKVIQYRAKLFTVTAPRVIYTYKYPQAWFTKFNDVEFVQEIPQHLDSNHPSMIVIDDIVCDPEVMKQCVSLFVRGSHHLNASVFFITQNLFASSSEFRTISLNANQFVLFKTVRGVHQVKSLAQQIYSKKETQEFLKAYKEATREPYSYLLLDFDPMQEHRLRSNIFPHEEEIIYLLE